MLIKSYKDKDSRIKLVVLYTVMLIASVGTGQKRAFR